MSDALEVRLLGPLEVIVRGRHVDVAGPKRQGLVALLALRTGRVVSVDALIDGLWGTELPAAPRNAVQHHIARLRAVFGPESIVAAPDGYALMDASVDALQFEELLGEARAALRAGDARAGAASVALALALWRGPALHGLSETPWFSAEARRLEALRVDALEEQFDAALALGEHDGIESALRATLEENPFRERLWGQLMLALYRSGRQADALETFQDARRVLTEQLALEPSPELRRLQESILAHDPAIAPVPHAPRRRGNVPTPSTSFVDREQALAQIVELLRQHRLVTLTGPPGVGKSRLALEVVRSVESEVRDGAWLIELARTGAGMDVVRLLAQIVDARGPDPLAGVLTRLRDVETILVLDACEHVIEDAAAVASAVLAGCPGVRVLATSREVLHLVGEVRLAVEPLELPAQESSDGADSPAVQLFAARASAARPGFQLTADAVPLVAEISRQVDGLPLAIELTAARVNVLGLAELLHLVEGRLAAGRDRPPSDLARAALGTLVEWSYDLLHGDERTLLHQLAVHRGGASLASLVAGAAHDGLDETTVTYLLGALVDKSVVSVSFPAAEARYDLLDTVRDYVLERLADAGRLGVARKAHAEYFATLADAARTGLRGPEWRTWVERLELEHDNLWAALDYAREAADSGITVRLGASLGWYFTLAERVSEGRRFVELALAALPDDRPAGDRLELVAFACYLATEELDFDAAIDVAERELARPAPDAKPAQSALVEAALALAVAGRGEAERAAALSQSAFTSTERTGNDWTIAAASLLRAQVAARAGDIPTVAAMAAEAHSRTDASGFDAFRVPALLLEAWVAKRRNEPERATDAYRRALALADRTGFSDHAAFALAGLGSIAFASGDLRHAEELERQALATAESARAPWAAAHARVELARVLRASGDDDTAERLYRNVLEWSEAPRPHQPRESLFIALERDPTAGAREGLAALAAARAEAPAAPAVT